MAIGKTRTVLSSAPLNKQQSINSQFDLDKQSEIFVFEYDSSEYGSGEYLTFHHFLAVIQRLKEL